MTQVADEQQEQKHDGAGKNHADQALGQDVYRHERSDTPAGDQTRISGLPAVQEKIEREPDPEAHGDIGNEDAGEKIGAAGSKKHHASPEPRSFREKTSPEKVEEDWQREGAEREKQPGAPGVGAEKLHACGHSPVG